MHRIGLKLWSVNTGDYLQEARRLFADGVFAYLELLVVPDSLGSLSEWKRLKDETGMPFVIHNAHFACGFNLADAARAGRNRAIYLQSRTFADALEARYVIFHGGMDGTVDETVRQLKSFEEPRALLENKPFVPLPNKTGARFCRGATVAEIEFVLSETGCGFCLDVGHAVCAANSQGLEPYAHVAALTRLKPAMFHLSNLPDLSSVHDAHLHFGAGVLDIQRLLREVIPRDAMVSIETVKDSSTNLEDFRRDAECL